MKKEIVTREDFDAHKDKPWQVVHGIWPGIRDLAGTPGPKGAIGLLGNTGPQGPEGDMGPQGASGPAGPTGPSGVTGAQGVIGESGPSGPTGPGGVTGPQGVIGESGPTGVVGPTGVEGAQGVMGERGIGHSMLGPGCMLYLPMIAAAGATVYDKSEKDYAMGLLNFDSGSVEPVLGELLTGATSEARAIVVSVNKTGGTWGGGDAVGSIVLEDCVGCFNNDENINGSFGGANILTVNQPDGAVGADKHIKNGAFVATADDWTPSNSTLASIAGGQVGNCLEITHTGAAYQEASQLITFEEGKIYKLSFYVKSGTSGDEAFRVGVVETGVVWRSYASGISSAAWVKHTHIFEADSTIDGLVIRKDTATAGTMLFDEITLYEIKKENDGTIVGAQWIFSEISEKCLYFDGINDYVSMSPSIVAIDSYSICFWMKSLGNTDVHIFEGQVQSSPSLEGSDAGYKFYVNDNQFIDTGAITPDQWYHIVCVWNEETGKIEVFVDGVSKGDISDTTDDAITTFYLASKGGASRFFNGLIDEVRIYKRALTLAEIEVIYNQRYLTGVEGEQGLQGITGPQGLQGITGPQGEQGPSGVTGTQGPQGITGTQGPQGTTGIEGTQGPQGPTGAEGDQGIPGIASTSIASDTLKNSNNAEKSTVSAFYYKLKETKLIAAMGKIRIYFEIHATLGSTAYGKIYKNGSPLGTERSTVSTAWIDFSEDEGPFAADDLIQIYVKTSDEAAFVRRLRFQYETVLPMTNQDP